MGSGLPVGRLVKKLEPDQACDLHFRVDGPVVCPLQEQFAIDWAFASGERLSGPAWFPRLSPVGGAPARVIPEGPDEDLNKMLEVMFQGLSAAMHSVLVVTPYFAPPPAPTAALEAAALRGVRVEVVPPEHNEPAFMGNWWPWTGRSRCSTPGCGSGSSPGRSSTGS
ncbi:MAG: hypothetical protein R3F59_33090 [Myxococcota bacterium]